MALTVISSTTSNVLSWRLIQNHCKRIVERHHGNIHVASNPGGGSRFVIELPLYHLDANDEE